jgi:predicted esterase
MKESQIEFVQQRRFYHNDLVGKDKIVIALHGYGQLGQYFYRKFHSIETEYGLVIAEGPHRFYLEGSSGRVGASWMTKEWREQDIEENNSYLKQLMEKVSSENPKATLYLLGFSQGGATAARLFQQYPSLASHLILWASVFPPDLEKPLFPQGKTLHFVLGNKDPYFDSDSFIKVQEAYTALGFKVHVFDGAHDIDMLALKVILNNS